MTSRKSSGSMRAESAVEPTRSENITVTWRRSAASASGRTGAELKSVPIRGGGQTYNRFEQTLAVPQRHAKFFKVVVGQLGQNIRVDFVRAERGLILIKPKVRSQSPTSMVAS